VSLSTFLPPLRGWDCEGRTQADAPASVLSRLAALCFWLAEDEWSENGSRARKCSQVLKFLMMARVTGRSAVPQAGQVSQSRSL